MEQAAKNFTDRSREINIEEILINIVRDDSLHRKWLNTLSYMENCGARKIINAEQPNSVSLMMLKHAAEETRHAFYFKNQMSRVGGEVDRHQGRVEKNEELVLPDFSFSHILGGTLSKNYITVLDLMICRYLEEEHGLKEQELKDRAYLLTTYSIEVRALKLYPLYERILRKNDSQVSIKGIILEENNHLKDMEKEIEVCWQNWKQVVARALRMEEELFLKWQKRLMAEVDQSVLN